MFTVVLLIVIAVLIIGLIAAYNGLVRSRIRIDEAWSDINVQLKRRYDLIPNLVNTVKGYAKHEKEAFENVSNARAAAMGATGIAQKAEAENQLAGALKSIFAISEAYPDLKANQSFNQLQAELTDTEDKISAARRFYNGSVRTYNERLLVFPTNLFGSMLGFTHRDFFEVADQAAVETPVEVKF